MVDHDDLVLSGVSDVFTTRQYTKAAGVPGQGVPPRLRLAETAGHVVNIRPGVWGKTRPVVGSLRSLDPATVLEALYGNRPVRYACRSALAGVPVPTEPIKTICTPFPVSGNQRLRQWGFNQHAESEATFGGFSELVTANVWRSSQPRALLESAQYPQRVYNPIVVMAYGMDVLEDEVDQVAEVADCFGWSAGLQRLQSVASELRAHWQYDALSIRINEAYCHLISRPRRWVHMSNSNRTPLGKMVAYVDFANRVLWDRTPDMIVEEFLW